MKSVKEQTKIMVHIKSLLWLNFTRIKIKNFILRDINKSLNVKSKLRNFNNYGNYIKRGTG